MFHAEGQTDMGQLIVGFPNFVKEPKNRSHGFRSAERRGNNPSLILLPQPNTRSEQRIELIELNPYRTNVKNRVSS